jgi:hypothetical protein
VTFLGISCSQKMKTLLKYKIDTALFVFQSCYIYGVQR